MYARWDAVKIIITVLQLFYPLILKSFEMIHFEEKKKQSNTDIQCIIWHELIKVF